VAIVATTVGYEIFAASELNISALGWHFDGGENQCDSRDGCKRQAEQGFGCFHKELFGWILMVLTLDVGAKEAKIAANAHDLRTTVRAALARGGDTVADDNASFIAS
jgi:hypothetical protein